MTKPDGVKVKDVGGLFLKPCPFHHPGNVIWVKKEDGCVFVECVICNARGPEVLRHKGFAMDKAVELWNDRGETK